MSQQADGLSRDYAGNNEHLEATVPSSQAISESRINGSLLALTERRNVSQMQQQQSHRRRSTVDPATFAERLNRLFDAIRPPGQRPIRNSEVIHALSERGYSLSAAYLSQLRTGSRSHPDPDAVSQLAQFFGVRRAYFTGEDVAYVNLVDSELYWLKLAHDRDVRDVTSALLRVPAEVREELLRAAEHGRC